MFSTSLISFRFSPVSDSYSLITSASGFSALGLICQSVQGRHYHPTNYSDQISDCRPCRLFLLRSIHLINNRVLHYFPISQIHPLSCSPNVTSLVQITIISKIESYLISLFHILIHPPTHLTTIKYLSELKRD